MTGTQVRAATEADAPAIASVAVATGQDEEWAGSDPAYLDWLLANGRLLVAVRDGALAGFGATRRIGAGPAAVSMLCDLFVHPDAHGLRHRPGGAGPAVAGRAAPDDVQQPARARAAAVHQVRRGRLVATAVRRGPGGRAARRRSPARWRAPGGWSVARADPAEVAAAELRWTGVDRAADHRAWAARPDGFSASVRRGAAVLAAGTVAGQRGEYGIVHLAMAPGVSDAGAAGAVLALLASLDPPEGRAQVCLPAPHPAVRPLLRAGWRVTDKDLYMASEPGLLDPRRAVPSPSAA